MKGQQSLHKFKAPLVIFRFPVPSETGLLPKEFSSEKLRKRLDGKFNRVSTRPMRGRSYLDEEHS